MIVRIVKVIVSLVAIAILIIALMLGWSVLNFKYIGPWQHERNTEKAEISNQTTWETGFADIYTIEVAVKVVGESRSVLMEVVCVPKTVTESISLKNAVFSRKLVLNFSPKYRYISVPDGYRAIVSTQLSCGGLAKGAEEQGLPFDLEDYQRRSIRHDSEASVTCFGHPDVGEWGTRQYFIWGSPIVVLSKSTERVRDVLTREEYGPADLAFVRKLKRESNENNYVRTDRIFHRSFYWSGESQCWRDTRASQAGSCSPWHNQFVSQICRC